MYGTYHSLLTEHSVETSILTDGSSVSYVDLYTAWNLKEYILCVGIGACWQKQYFSPVKVR